MGNGKKNTNHKGLIDKMLENQSSRAKNQSFQSSQAKQIYRQIACRIHIGIGTRQLFFFFFQILIYLLHGSKRYLIKLIYITYQTFLLENKNVTVALSEPNERNLVNKSLVNCEILHRFKRETKHCLQERGNLSTEDAF